MPPELNKKYILNIESLSSSGDAVSHIDGFAVFVHGACAGDVVEAKITKLNKSYGFAKLLKVLTPSPARRTPPCPHFSECGGCQLMNINYDEQCRFKANVIHDALLRIGGMDCNVEFCPAPEELRYRNKMIFPFSSGGEWGFYKSGSHDVVPLNDCLLGDSLNPEILDCVKNFFRSENIPFYNEKNHTGVLRRVFTRTSAATGNIMTVISINADSVPHTDKLVKSLRKLSSGITDIILNINKKRTNLVLGEKNIILYGTGRLRDTLCGLTYDISAHSFFQINHAQTERLYEKALELAAPDESKNIFDLYCGIGTISLCAAQKAKHVVGVEIVPEAIADAKENAVRNNIKNAEFYCAPAEEIVPKLIYDGIIPDTVILDPPRKGSDEKTLAAIIHAAPERIVYVSCNPSTLARDAKIICNSGYKISKTVGFDLFPQTVHAETICLMSRICSGK